MTISTIIAEVQVLTEKPGSTHLPLIKNAVRRAILSCHAVARFQRDLREAVLPGFAVDTATYKFTAALPDRFRKEYEVLALYADGSCRRDFKIAQEEGLLDYFQFPVPRTVFLMGNNITVNYEGAPSALHLRYFQFPEIDMTAETTESWIVTAFDTPIIHKAAYNIFAATGDAESRTWQGELYGEAKAELLANFEAID